MRIRRFMELLAVINPLISFSAYHMSRRKMINSSLPRVDQLRGMLQICFSPIASLGLSGDLVKFFCLWPDSLVDMITVLSPIHWSLSLRLIT